MKIKLIALFIMMGSLKNERGGILGLCELVVK